MSSYDEECIFRSGDAVYEISEHPWVSNALQAVRYSDSISCILGAFEDLEQAVRACMKDMRRRAEDAEKDI